jgi:hypothetical protein
MISGFENIRKIFSIFHDGSIVGMSENNSGIELTVEIIYLANRVKSSYESFSMFLHDAKQVSFDTWPSNNEVESFEIIDIYEIFKPELEILSAELEGNICKVACNQSSKEFEFCGGTLKFMCNKASVKDSGGKEYGIEELGEICSEYWEE